MAPKHSRPVGLAYDFADVVKQVVTDYTKDRRLCFTLALGISSLAAYTVYQTSQPKIEEQFRLVESDKRVKAASRQSRKQNGRVKQAAAPAPASAAPPSATDDDKEKIKDDKAVAVASSSSSSPLSAGAAGTTPREVKVIPGAAISQPPLQAPPPPRRKAAAVDATFVKRLAFILRIVVPSITSKEAVLLAIQSLMLVSRSFISLRIARKGGDGLQAVMERSWKKFFLVLGDFFVSGVAASVVNSALKYLTNSITVAFRQRLTVYVHRRYLADRAYYRAAVLRVGNLDNADQRIAEDLNQFCHTAADLFGRTFKPLLDVVLSTVRMGENMGYGGLSILYAYFFLSGAVLRAASPPFSEYIARTQKLEGDFRRMHSRLITHAEEVAFLDGAERERAILDAKLESTTTWSQFYFYLQFKQGIVDQYVVKYFASMIGWPVLAFPFLADSSAKSPAEIAARYRESDTLIQSASTSIGDLMMVYKKLQRLAGFTARVVELLEAVDTYHTHGLGGDAEAVGVAAGASARLGEANARSGKTAAAAGGGGGDDEENPGRPLPPAPETPTGGGVKSMVAALESKSMSSSCPGGPPHAVPSGNGGAPSTLPRESATSNKTMVTSSDTGTSTSGGIFPGAAEDGVRFDGVTVYSPDGRLLVRDVTFALEPGQNLFVTGANGAGKTSLFRVLAGLWWGRQRG